MHKICLEFNVQSKNAVNRCTAIWNEQVDTKFLVEPSWANFSRVAPIDFGKVSKFQIFSSYTFPTIYNILEKKLSIDKNLLKNVFYNFGERLSVCKTCGSST